MEVKQEIRRVEDAENAACSSITDNEENNSDISSATDHSQTSRGVRKHRPYAPHAKSHSLNGYNKKKMLDHLERNGCNAKNFENALKSYKVSRESALGFLSKHIEQAQKHVHEECDSLSFSNNNAWLEVFNNANLPKYCMYEPALVVNYIANNETQPNVHELGGVDLKSIYKFLGNALFGLPQTELNAASASFLSREFESLIDEVNTDIGDANSLEIDSQLKNLQPTNRKQRSKFSLDPLGLDPNIK